MTSTYDSERRCVAPRHPINRITRQSRLTGGSERTGYFPGSNPVARPGILTSVLSLVFFPNLHVCILHIAARARTLHGTEHLSTCARATTVHTSHTVAHVGGISLRHAHDRTMPTHPFVRCSASLTTHDRCIILTSASTKIEKATTHQPQQGAHKPHHTYGQRPFPLPSSLPGALAYCSLASSQPPFLI